MTCRYLENKISWLDDDVVEKNLKLKVALTYITEMRDERDDALNKLKDLQPKIATLGENVKKLTEAESARDAVEEAKTQADQDKAKVAKKNKELVAQVKSLKDQVEGLEAYKMALNERVGEVAAMGKGAAEYEFKKHLSR